MVSQTSHLFFYGMVLCPSLVFGVVLKQRGGGVILFHLILILPFQVILLNDKYYLIFTVLHEKYV